MKHLRPSGYAIVIVGLLSFLAAPAGIATPSGTGTVSGTVTARYTTTNNNIGTTPPRQIGITLRLDF